MYYEILLNFFLDFPHYASFAAVKLVMWWEEQFKGAFRKPSGLIGTACEDVTDVCIILLLTDLFILQFVIHRLYNSVILIVVVNNLR